jgi:hypothetical protein
MPQLIGTTIQAIRPMTQEELALEGWDYSARSHVMALELSDGSLLYPSRDEEGSGPGELFGTDPEGEQFFVMPEQPQRGGDTP